VEDLGSGMKAKFQFEADPSLVANDGNKFNTSGSGASDGTVAANGATQTTGTASAQSGLVGAGYSYIGLETKAGEVQFGTINTQTLGAFGVASQMFGTAVGSGYKKGIYGGYTRYENSMAYFSPSFNGFNFRYQNAAGNNSQYGTTTGIVLRRPTINEVGLAYANGPVTVQFANLTSKGASADASTSADVTTKINTLGAKYDAKVAIIGFGMQNLKDDYSTVTETKAQNISVVVPYGAWRFGVNSASHKTNSSTYASLNGTKSTFVGWGVQYDLSKRTYVYLSQESATMADLNGKNVVINGANFNTSNALLTDNKRSITAVGISHAF